MRVGFGLIGLLVTIGVIVWIMAKVELPADQAAINAGNHVRPQLEQISGVDQNGTPVEQTVSFFHETNAANKLVDLQVTKIDPNSPMQKLFGLQVDDVITAAVADHGVRIEMAGADPKDAEIAVFQAYRMNGSLEILRNGQAKTLTPAPQPANAAAPQTKEDPLGGTVEGVLKPVPTH